MLSTTHLIILLVVVLVIFGPSRLPGLGKSLGESIRGFKKGIDGEGDIDVTNSAKRIEEEKEKEKEKTKS